MELENLLQKIGLTPKESKVYLSSLQLGQDTAFNIAKKAEIKRSTCYVILDSLIEKGFITILKTKKALLFIPQEPAKLLEFFKEKEDLLKEALPELIGLFNLSPQKPKIQVFQGKTGIETIYQEVIDSLKKSEVLIFGTLEHFKNAYQNPMKRWQKATKNKRFKVREIITQEKFNIKYLKQIKENKNPDHQIKVLPKDKKIFDNDNIVYANKLAIFSTKKELFVVLIESPSIVNTYRILFDLAWHSAKRYSR
jgi:sugar-specific transcriptional regulator TrmB